MNYDILHSSVQEFQDESAYLFYVNEKNVKLCGITMIYGTS